MEANQNCELSEITWKKATMQFGYIGIKLDWTISREYYYANPKYISGWNPAGSSHYRMHLKDPPTQGVFRWHLKYDEKRDQNSIAVHHSITVWVVI